MRAVVCYSVATVRRILEALRLRSTSTLATRMTVSTTAKLKADANVQLLRGWRDPALQKIPKLAAQRIPLRTSDAFT